MLAHKVLTSKQTDKKKWKVKFSKTSFKLKNTKFSKSVLFYLSCCATGCNSDLLLCTQIKQKATQGFEWILWCAATNTHISISTRFLLRDRFGLTFILLLCY